MQAAKYKRSAKVEWEPRASRRWSSQQERGLARLGWDSRIHTQVIQQKNKIQKIKTSKNYPGKERGKQKKKKRIKRLVTKK